MPSRSMNSSWGGGGMGFLADLLQRLKGGSSQSGPRPQVGFTTDDGQALWIYLECENCGEHQTEAAQD